MADYVDSLILPTTGKLKRKKYTSNELDKLRALAREGAYDEDAIEGAEFFPVNASANTIDSYGTFMMESTLRNFAEDAQTGVSVLDSHNSRRLNFGMSVTGEYMKDGDVKFMRSDFFTLPGLKTEGLDTDTYIRGLKAGLFRDVSVGFWMPAGSIIRCTICGGDMMRWWSDQGCLHFPGVEYEIEGDGKKRTEVAYGAVDGARLSEYSVVHDGATPGAGVAKARHMEDADALTPDTALQLERQYNTVFPRAARRYHGVGLSLIGGPDMKPQRKQHDPEEEAIGATDAKVEGTEAAVIEPTVDDTPEFEPTVVEQFDALVEDDQITSVPAAVDDADEEGERAIEKSMLRLPKNLRTALNERYAADKITVGDRVADVVVTLADEVKRLRGELTTAHQSNRSLESDAKIGREYRKKLVKSLREEVIRSASEGEDPEAKAARYERMAESADTETIEALTRDFAEIAKAKFGQRKSIDVEENEEKRPVRKVPVTAYDDIRD